MITLNPSWSLSQTETDIAFLGELISDIFQAVTEDTIPEMGFGMTYRPVGHTSDSLALWNVFLAVRLLYWVTPQSVQLGNATATPASVIPRAPRV